MASILTLDELDALRGQELSSEQLRSLFLSLESDDEETRAASCDCLTDLPQLPVSEMDVVLGFVKNVSDARGLWALRVLCNHFGDHEKTQSALAQALLAGTLPVKQEAAKSLSKIKSDGQALLPQSVTALAAQLKSTDPRLLRFVQLALET